MISIPELDQRMVGHLVQAAGAGRAELILMEEAARATGGTRPRGCATVVAMVRRRLGETLVGIGERLRGAPAGHAGGPATAR